LNRLICGTLAWANNASARKVADQNHEESFQTLLVGYLKNLFLDKGTAHELRIGVLKILQTILQKHGQRSLAAGTPL